VTLLFTFETVSAALNCEDILKTAGRSCRVIPVPRSLSASCAYAISLEAGSPEDPAAPCRDLRSAGAGFVKAFRCTEAGGKEQYDEIDLTY
jgi:hypothetical protein